MEGVDLGMVNWARSQFALTAMYHWLFVPLTLGLSMLCAFFETIYVRTGNEEWKRITRFWMTLFGINFAIGVATGIIMEFEFGTNWSNYSWMVGDIFGAPLAIEGIVAFFLEATFFAVMFFGWDRVSKGFHLFSTWMVAIGSNLSALWILVANGWMQHPVGMAFNPDTVRFEMQNFWEVLFSPVAMAKFTHTTSTSFLVGALFVIAISSWYLLRGRHTVMARRSIIVASAFGLLSSAYVAVTGDESAFANASKQPMKLAAYEGLYKGRTDAPMTVFGIVNGAKKPGDDQSRVPDGRPGPRPAGATLDSQRRHVPARNRRSGLRQQGAEHPVGRRADRSGQGGAARSHGVQEGQAGRRCRGGRGKPRGIPGQPAVPGVRLPAEARRAGASRRADLLFVPPHGRPVRPLRHRVPAVPVGRAQRHAAGQARTAAGSAWPPSRWR